MVPQYTYKVAVGLLLALAIGLLYPIHKKFSKANT